MQKVMIYVIRDKEGNFIVPKELKNGYCYLKYTGICTGFTYYSKIDTLIEKLNALNDMGNNFYYEKIDYNSIPLGVRLKY